MGLTKDQGYDPMEMAGNKGGKKGSPLIALHGLNLCRSLSNHKESLTKFTKQKCGCSNP